MNVPACFMYDSLLDQLIQTPQAVLAFLLNKERLDGVCIQLSIFRE